jgi:hypothetical protein
LTDPSPTDAQIAEWARSLKPKEGTRPVYFPEGIVDRVRYNYVTEFNVPEKWKPPVVEAIRPEQV